MTNQVSRPFPADEPKPPVVIPPRNPVQEAARAMRQRAAEERAEQIAELRAYAQSEWESYRRDHPFSERAKFMDEFMSVYADELDAPYRWAGLSDAALYRISLDPAERLERLLEAGCFADAIQVWVYRHNGRSSITEIAAMLAPYGTLSGEQLSKLLDQAGMTVRGTKVFWFTGQVQKEQNINGPVLPVEMREYRDTLCMEDESFDSSLY